MKSVAMVNEIILVSDKNNIAKNEPDQLVFGQKMGLSVKLFGCWHKNISRPFIQGKTAYRSCLQCGARKQFNPETLKTHGNFYFPPLVKN